MAHSRIFLIRHGEAARPSGQPHAERGLTAAGRRRLRKAGALLFEHAGYIELALTSPLVRAVQTTEIIANAVGLDDDIIAMDAIAHAPSIESIIDRLCDPPNGARSLMLVGHEPSLSLIAALLLEQAAYPRRYQTGDILALDLNRRTRRAQFEWLITGDPPQTRLSLDLEP